MRLATMARWPATIFSSSAIFAAISLGALAGHYLFQ
jgi:hypothetical protein